MNIHNYDSVIDMHSSTKSQYIFDMLRETHHEREIFKFPAVDYDLRAA